MQDITATITIPTTDPSITGIAVTWTKNGGAPVVKNHATSLPTFTVYPFSYLTDNGPGATLAIGDVVSASATTFNSGNVMSTSVASTPASVAIPSTPPAPPTTVTLALN